MTELSPWLSNFPLSEIPELYFFFFSSVIFLIGDIYYKCSQNKTLTVWHFLEKHCKGLLKSTKTKYYYGFKKLTREKITNDFLNDGQKYDCSQKLKEAVLKWDS